MSWWPDLFHGHRHGGPLLSLAAEPGDQQLGSLKLPAAQVNLVLKLSLLLFLLLQVIVERFHSLLGLPQLLLLLVQLLHRLLMPVAV